MDASGCGAAWLARLLGVQEVLGSNPGSPTKTPQTLTVTRRPKIRGLESNWSPRRLRTHQPTTFLLSSRLLTGETAGHEYLCQDGSKLFCTAAPRRESMTKS